MMKALLRSSWLSGGLAALLLAGCGVAPSDEESPTDTSAQPVQDDNGLDTNGLDTNGLDTNGLDTNGLDTNGLRVTAFNTTTFKNWFNKTATDRTKHEKLMFYLVKCALPSTTTLNWTNPTTGTPYAWQGALNLAPGWASGTAPTVQQEELLSGCLAAHVNAAGVHVNVSFRSNVLSGSTPLIPVTATEATNYDKSEAAFVGNLFRAPNKVYIIARRDSMPNYISDYIFISNPRGCAAGGCGALVAETTASSEGCNVSHQTQNGRKYPVASTCYVENGTRTYTNIITTYLAGACNRSMSNMCYPY